ncbi:putative indoleacetaldoxime dehydratase [Helianthus annuus]|nr:putative indoleacetaldoxime dehydratase [Helianthus annuus]
MHLHLGSVPTLVVSSAEAAHEIMKTHDSSFANRPNLTILNILLYGCKDIAFSPSGKYRRQLKSMVVKHLLGNAQVTSFEKVREKELGRMLDALGKSCGCKCNSCRVTVAYQFCVNQSRSPS